MAVIGVDSSGIITQTPVYMAAVRHVNTQKHNIIHLDKSKEDEYQKMIRKDWRWKLSAILIFKSVEPLIKQNDIIQIDTDFQGKNRKKIESYLKKLFGKKYLGKMLSNPKIQFIPSKLSEDVKLADKKSKRARRHKINVVKCPNLRKEIDILN